MKKGKKFLGILLSVCAACSCFACGDVNPSEPTDKDKPTTPTLQLAQEQQWVNITTYSDDILNAYMQPIWYTREVYDESVAMIGETGSASLLYTPKAGSVIVRDYKLQTTYVEGVDYKIEGKTITRLAGGNLKYRDKDLFDKNAVNTSAPVQYHLNVSYKTDDLWDGLIPQAQTEKVSKFMNKVKNDKAASIMFYGDSITFGCSASSSPEGGNINPKLPIWPNLVSTWLKRTYNADITTWNKAVGGWTSTNGWAKFNEEVMSVGATNIDLLLLGFGMNDGTLTSKDNYLANMKDMVDTYLNANPNGSVVLVSTMNPTSVASPNWLGHQPQQEGWLTEEIANKHDNVAIAQVNSVFTHLETHKLTRDWLANNINHPNDFGVRVYAQVLLKTLAGDDFCKEIYA